MCVFMREQSRRTSVRTPGDASTNRVDRPAEDVHHVLVY